MTDCLLCQDQAQGYSTFLQNELFHAMWDLNPVTPGHAIIVLGRHVQYLHDLTPEEKTGLLAFVEEAIAVICRTDLTMEYRRLLNGASGATHQALQDVYNLVLNGVVAPDAFNHGLNDGEAAGQTIPHFHYHIMPRRLGDTENPRGGVRRMLGEDAYSARLKGI